MLVLSSYSCTLTPDDLWYQITLTKICGQFQNLHRQVHRMNQSLAILRTPFKYQFQPKPGPWSPTLNKLGRNHLYKCYCLPRENISKDLFYSWNRIRSWFKWFMKLKISSMIPIQINSGFWIHRDILAADIRDLRYILGQKVYMYLVRDDSDAEFIFLKSSKPSSQICHQYQPSSTSKNWNSAIKEFLTCKISTLELQKISIKFCLTQNNDFTHAQKDSH